ncbi:MAG: CHAT domain-containing protein [Pseudonocardiaceae bacterium]
MADPLALIRASWPGFLLIAGTAWDSAVSRKGELAWQELVWGLDQVIKARSLQDERAEPAVWQRFLASDGELRRLTAEVEQAEFDLQVALSGGSAQAAATARDTLEERRRLQGKRLRALAPHSEALLSLTSSPMVALPAFQSRLARGEMYVGFVKCPGDRLLRLRVTAEHSEFDAVEVPHIESYLQAELHGAGFGGDHRRLLLDAASRLIGPLPTDVDTLLICPDRALVTVGWHLVPTRSGSLLGDDVTIAVLPAAGALAQFRQGLAHADAPHSAARYLGVADDGGNLAYVDYEIENIRRNYFATDGQTFPTGEGSLLLVETGHVELLHLACHATVAGLVIGGRSITPIDLADLNLSAEILLLTGCNTGAFGHDENTEFFGIVRQLLVATRAKAAIVSRHPIFDPSGPLFSDLVVAALTHHAPARPWPLPDHRLPVGQAVRWARSTMRRLSKDDAHAVLPDVSVRPRSLVWWSPWFVVGDPSARIRPSGI